MPEEFKAPQPGSWRPGKGYGAIVSQDPELLAELAEHDRAFNETHGYAQGERHSTAEAYGGALICETVHSRFRSLISLTPDLYHFAVRTRAFLEKRCVTHGLTHEMQRLWDAADTLIRMAQELTPLDPPKSLPAPAGEPSPESEVPCV